MPAPYPRVIWLNRDPSARVARSDRMRQVRDDGAGPRRGRHRTRPAPAHRARSGAVSREGMVEEVVKTYHVAYERDESGWWVASVRELRGCHTQGRTVDEARRRIVEAMELFIDNGRSAKIVDHVKLPAAAKKAIRAYATLRRRAAQEDRRAALAARRAVKTFQTRTPFGRSGRMRSLWGCARGPMHWSSTWPSASASAANTIKNVDISIPNASVLGRQIINCSSSAHQRGLILHTAVTIGYDVIVIPCGGNTVLVRGRARIRLEGTAS